MKITHGTINVPNYQLQELTQELFLVLYKNSPGSKIEYLFDMAHNSAKEYIVLQEKKLS